MNMLRLALRNLRREWHLPELRTLAASLVLAVVALGVVATLATRVERGMLASAAELIGGDIGIGSPQALPESFAAKATQDNLTLTRTASFPSVAFAHEHAQMLDVEAADPQYPLRGTLELADAAGRQRTGRGPPQAPSISIIAPWSPWASRWATGCNWVDANCASPPNWCVSPMAVNCWRWRRAR